MSYKVTISELRARAAEIQKILDEEGFIATVHPYFAYGAYSYYIDFKNPNGGIKRQTSTTLGTKKECLARLNDMFYKVLNHSDYYKFKTDLY